MNKHIENYLAHLHKLQQPKKSVFAPAEIQTAWYSVGRYLHKDYQFDDVAKAMFPDLFRPDNEKGVFISGTKGIGKTLNLDIFAKLNNDLYRIKTEVWEATEIEIQYKANGAGLLDRLGGLPALVVNDVGIESKTLNDYGTDRNLIADLMYLRYRTYQTKGFKTYISCNLKWETLLSQYGVRLADRMSEMFLPVYVEGKSRRK